MHDFKDVGKCNITSSQDVGSKKERKSFISLCSTLSFLENSKVDFMPY